MWSWRPAPPLAAVLCGVLLLAPAPRAGDATPGAPHEVKAAHLLHFARFVEWPAEAFAERTALEICVLGDPPLHRSLAPVARDGTVSGRPIAPSLLDAPRRIERCHVLFVAERFHGDMEGMLPVVHRAHVLLVGEGRGFLARGGAIAFVRDEGRVRFDLDLRSAARAGLKVRAQLVQVARQVQRDDGG